MIFNIIIIGIDANLLRDWHACWTRFRWNPLPMGRVHSTFHLCWSFTSFEFGSLLLLITIIIQFLCIIWWWRCFLFKSFSYFLVRTNRGWPPNLLDTQSTFFIFFQIFSKFFGIKKNLFWLFGVFETFFSDFLGFTKTFLEWDYKLIENFDWYIDGNKGGFLKMIKIPSISLALYGVFVGTSCLGFLDATLEPHLRQVMIINKVNFLFNLKNLYKSQFELSPSIMGLIFTIGGAVFAITGPLFGYAVEKWIKPTTCILFGTLLVLLGFVFIGPIHFLPLET